MNQHKVHRYHDICAGHRVVGHEGKCQHLHGHNYRIHFTCTMDTGNRSRELGIPEIHLELDDIGRVIDFSVVKEKLCMWIENNWDHKFLHWEADPLIGMLYAGIRGVDDLHYTDEEVQFTESLVSLPFNPTAENLAQYLVDVVGPVQLDGTGVVLTHVLIEETAKCHASYGAA